MDQVKTAVAEKKQVQVVNFDSLLSEVQEQNPVAVIATAHEGDAHTKQIDALINRITGLTSDSSPEAQELTRQVESFGINVQKNSGKRSQMLKQSIGKLDPTSEDSKDGKPTVGNLLMDLNQQMIELDPSGVSLDKPWWANLQQIPVIGPFLKTPIQKYFMKYQSADSVIDNIRAGLTAGQNQLKNDSKILESDQQKMRASAIELEQAIAAGLYLKNQLDTAVSTMTDEKMVIFIKDQLLFPLNQRVMDLQQQLAVNQQGIMTSAVIIRTNKELIRGVDRALTVTMTAMEIAVSLSLALANQKIVLKQLHAVNKSTSEMIANTGAMLRQNAASIQEQATQATLDMGMLKQAMQDTRMAVEEVRNFRVRAIEHMTHDIHDLNDILAKNQETIKDMDEGERVRENFDILKNQ